MPHAAQHWAMKQRGVTIVDESAKPTDQPEVDRAADDAPKGDFLLSELQQAYSRNFDHEGRRIDRPKDGDYTPENGQQ